MRLEKCKPVEIPKDPSKALAQRRAKRQAFAEVMFSLLGIAAVLYYFTHPASLYATIAFLQELFRPRS